MLINQYLDNVGNTPMVQLRVEAFPQVNLHAKLEFYNPMGSVKDRAASYLLKQLLEKQEIDHEGLSVIVAVRECVQETRKRARRKSK